MSADIRWPEVDVIGNVMDYRASANDLSTGGGNLELLVYPTTPSILVTR